MKWLMIGFCCLSLAACGGTSKTDDDVIHLDGGDIPVANFQAQMRLALSGNIFGGAAACRGVQGLNDEGLVTYLKGLRARDTGSTSTPEPVVTPRPGQKATDKDILKYGQVFQSECRRLFP